MFVKHSSLYHVPGSELPRPLEFPETREPWGILYSAIWCLLLTPEVPRSPSHHRVLSVRWPGEPTAGLVARGLPSREGRGLDVK